MVLVWPRDIHQHRTKGVYSVFTFMSRRHSKNFIETERHSLLFLEPNGEQVASFHSNLNKPTWKQHKTVSQQIQREGGALTIGQPASYLIPLLALACHMRSQPWRVGHHSRGSRTAAETTIITQKCQNSRQKPNHTQINNPNTTKKQHPRHPC